MKYSLSRLEINGTHLFSENNFLPTGTEERIALSINKKNNKGVYFETDWEIKNDELILSKFYNPSESFTKFFDCHRLDPFSVTKAKWVNGKYNFYENAGDKEALQIEFLDGKITSHKILFPFDFEYFNFGKYRNSKYSDVIYGLNDERNFEIYKKIVNDLISFLLAEKEDLILFPNINIKNFENDFNILRNNKINYLVIDNYICVEETRIGTEFSNFLQFLMESSWKLTRLLSHNFLEALPNNNQFLNNDFNYILWALENVESFVLKEEFTKSTTIKRFENFSIKRINEFIFEFTPQFSTHFVNFSEEIKQFNQRKIKELEKEFCINDTVFAHISKYEEILQNSKPKANNWKVSNSTFDISNIERDYFYTMTDGTLGDYEDFLDNGGSVDDIDTWSRG